MKALAPMQSTGHALFNEDIVLELLPPFEMHWQMKVSFDKDQLSREASIDNVKAGKYYLGWCINPWTGRCSLVERG